MTHFLSIPALMVPAFLGLVLTAVGGAAAWAQADGETFRSLYVRQAGALALAPDPRLHLGAEGTIEMWIAVSKEQPRFDPRAGDEGYCIMQHGDAETGIDWRLMLPPDGNGLIFKGAYAASELRQQFLLAGDSYHHIALTTAGGRTQVVIDGTAAGERGSDGLPFPGAEVGYAPATMAGRPLVIGCEDGGPPAHVWISSLRLWTRALTPGDLRWSQQFNGWPEGRPDLTQHLTAYAMFTDQRQEVLFPQSPIVFSKLEGGIGGTPFFHRRPADQELAAMYFRPEGGLGITDLIVEYDRPTRKLELTDGTLAELSAPTVLPERSRDPSIERTAVLRRMIEDVARQEAEAPGSSNPEDVDYVRKQFTTERQKARQAALGLDDENGVENFGDAPGGTLYHARRASLGDNERIVRIAGVHDGSHVFAARVDTDLRHDRLIGISLPGGDVFNLTVPDGARFEGVAGRRDGNRITAIGIAWSYPPHPVQRDLPARIAQGSWVDRDLREPHRLTSVPRTGQDGTPFTAPAEFHGTYEDQAAFRFTYRAADQTLYLHEVRPSLHKTPVIEHIFVHRQIDGRWQELGGRRSTLILDDDEVRWTDGDGVTETVLVRPAAYEPPHDDKLPWGATFSLDQRPRSIQANYLGYLPYKMQARDYQATTGTDKLLFALPKDNSRDFTTTGAHVIVPHGLLFRLDSKGSERTASQTSRDAAQRQSAWSLSLGVKVGVQGLFSFGEDVDYQESQDAMHALELSNIMNRAISTQYAMVMDLTRIKLSDELQARILQMRDRYLVEEPIEWDSFFKIFGTHYPYAITYGGMAWMETAVTKEEVALNSSQEIKVKAEAEGTFEELFNIGAKVGGSYKSGSGTSGELSGEDSVFGTYGGSFSRGGGWSMAHGEEVPLLLDLRPIYELLNPVFFDDPLIFGPLHDDMQTALEAYEKKLAQVFKGQMSWASSIRLDIEDQP